MKTQLTNSEKAISVRGRNVKYGHNLGISYQRAYLILAEGLFSLNLFTVVKLIWKLPRRVLKILLQFWQL